VPAKVNNSYLRGRQDGSHARQSIISELA
jgi:hypothetical protein